MADAPAPHDLDYGRSGRRKPIRICLAASGGGHLRQIMDLKPIWSAYDHVFVTEASALGESIAREHRCEFVQHYSIGQARWGHPFRMIAGMIRNLVQSVAFVARHRPDVVITTGAGAVFWTCLLSRLLGARLIMIESFARFDGPSTFGRMVRPFASDLIVQSAALKALWPEATVFDPFKILGGQRPAKKKLALATVGVTLPFDRLLDAVVALADRGIIDEELIIQTGRDTKHAGGQRGDRILFVKSLGFGEVQTLLRDADLVIMHGGTGSLVTALREGCRIVAMPRRFQYKELYDDHQLEIIQAFADRGLIEVALEADDLEPAIARARAKEPAIATTDPAELMAWLDDRLRTLGGEPAAALGAA